MKHSEVCVVNAYGITVKKMCASCAMKEVQNDGERVCQKMGLKVKQQFCCRHWQMSDGLKNAGLQNGGCGSLLQSRQFSLRSQEGDAPVS